MAKISEPEMEDTFVKYIYQMLITQLVIVLLVLGLNSNTKIVTSRTATNVKVVSNPTGEKDSLDGTSSTGKVCTIIPIQDIETEKPKRSDSSLPWAFLITVYAAGYMSRNRYDRVWRPG